MPITQSKFTELDILRVFLHLDKIASRAELVKTTTLSERSIRTILEILKRNKLVKSTQKGHFFSDNGKRLVDKINKIIEVRYDDNLKRLFQSKQVAILIKKHDFKHRIDYNLRDIAVRLGATGTMVLAYKKNNLILPPDNRKLSKEHSWLKGIFKFRENNFLVFAWGDSTDSVERGALQIALRLNSRLKKILKSLLKRF